MAMNGTDLLILANIGTPETPSYMAVGCQRDATIDRQNAVIDVSCKSSRAQRVLAGRYSATISLDALYIPDDQAWQALNAAMLSGENILMAREEKGVVTETFPAVVTGLSESYPDQGEATISATFTVDGFPTPVVS